MPDDKYITREEAALLCRVHVRTVDAWRRMQWVRATVIGRVVRIERASVERLIDQGERRERKWARGRNAEALRNGQMANGQMADEGRTIAAERECVG